MSGTESSTLVDACERELRRWIVRGEVRPGERLPPERELAARLGVNRTTLRSALTRLASGRLVRVRQGSGYVVQDPFKGAGLELVGDLVDEDALPRLANDLLRVRRALIALALDRGSAPNTASVIREVDLLCERVGVGAPTGDLAASEHAVFAELLAWGSSPVLSLHFNSVWFALRSLPRMCEALYGEPDDVIAQATAVRAYVDTPRAAMAEAVVSLLVQRDAAAVERLGSAGVPALG